MKIKLNDKSEEVQNWQVDAASELLGDVLIKIREFPENIRDNPSIISSMLIASAIKTAEATIEERIENIEEQLQAISSKIENLPQ